MAARPHRAAQRARTHVSARSGCAQTRRVGFVQRPRNHRPGAPGAAAPWDTFFRTSHARTLLLPETTRYAAVTRPRARPHTSGTSAKYDAMRLGCEAGVFFPSSCSCAGFEPFLPIPLPRAHHTGPPGGGGGVGAGARVRRRLGRGWARRGRTEDRGGGPQRRRGKRG